MKTILHALSVITFFLIASTGHAQDREVPYWASLRADEVKRKGLPVKIVRVVEGWRLVQDPDGTQGWIVARLLNPQRTAVVIEGELLPMREDPSETSLLKWKLEPGVVGILRECVDGWCELDIDGRIGWVNEARLWGVGDP